MASILWGRWGHDFSTWQGLSPGQSDLKGGSPTASQAHLFVDNNTYSLLEVMRVTLAAQI